MKKIIDYYIVCDDLPDKFFVSMKEAFKKDLQPYGNPFFNPVTCQLYQAMVKYESDDEYRTREAHEQMKRNAEGAI